MFHVPESRDDETSDETEYPLGGGSSSSSSSSSSSASASASSFFGFAGSAGYRRAIERALYHDLECGLKMTIDLFAVMTEDRKNRDMKQLLADFERIEADIQLIEASIGAQTRGSSSSLTRAGDLAFPAAVAHSARRIEWMPLFYKHCRHQGIAGNVYRAEAMVRHRLQDLRERTGRYRGSVELLLPIIKKCEAIVARLRRIQRSNYDGFSVSEDGYECVAGDGSEASFMAEVSSTMGCAGFLRRPMQGDDAIELLIRNLWKAQTVIVEPASGAVPTDIPRRYIQRPIGASRAPYNYGASTGDRRISLWVVDRLGRDGDDFSFLDLEFEPCAFKERTKDMINLVGEESFEGYPGEIFDELILTSNKSALPHTWGWPL